MSEYPPVPPSRDGSDAVHELPPGLVSLRTLEHEFESLRARSEQLDSELDQWRRRVVERSAPPSVRRAWVRTLVENHGVSERTACRLLEQHRSTQRYRSPNTYRLPARERTAPEPRPSVGIEPVPGRAARAHAIRNS